MKASAMKKKMPVRLKKEPLIEAVWETRFTSEKQNVADLLPGLIYQAIPGRYQNIVRLPVADIPAPIAEQDPNLRYIPKIRMEGDNQAIQIGEHVLSLSCRRPYPGWKGFSADIRNLIAVGRKTGLIDRLDRFSLKYLDLIQLVQPPDLGVLNIDLKLGGYSVAKQPVQLRTEIIAEGLIHIIQVVSPAEVTLPGDATKTEGVLLDIDTIASFKEGGSWDDVEKRLDATHSASKKIFFDLLKAGTIARLEPEYPQ